MPDIHWLTTTQAATHLRLTRWQVLARIRRGHGGAW